MIWIKRHDFIFVKIPKNASEAASLYLQQNVSCCEDVFTLDNGFQQNIFPPHASHCHMDIKYMLDNHLCTNTNTFVGVIRDPHERLLSLYLYRCRQNRYGVKATPEDFRKRAYNGFIVDHPWQMQLQSTFLTGALHKEYWCYDNIHYHVSLLPRRFNFVERHPFQTVNKSVPNIDTKSLVDTFYDQHTRSAVDKYWADDIDLYHEVKNAETGLDTTI